MNKSILISGAALATIGLFAATTFAATSTAPSTGTNTMASMWSKMIHGWWWGHGKSHVWEQKGRLMMSDLTPTEQTALTSMTDIQKRDFFEKKHTEMEAKRDARESIIDKLLAGTTLTPDEEVLRKTIITERAAHVVKEIEVRAKMTEMKAIFDKKKSGTALTADEQKLLDSIQKMGVHGRDKTPEAKDANGNDIETDDDIR
jgi:Spy/CpxP family protein refolding chaperone